MKAKIFDILKKNYSESFANSSNTSPLISATVSITEQAR